MLSLWGKLTKTGAKHPEGLPEGAFYYKANYDNILSTDGSAYVIPNLSAETTEQSEFIPFEYAQGKIRELVTEAQEAKKAYDSHIGELNAFYRKTIQDTKDYYEKNIEDIKEKAIRHVEIQKDMKKRMEQKLNKDLKASEDHIEELRDTMATRNFEYHEEIRKLKEKLTNSEEKINSSLLSITNLQRDSECKFVLLELMAKVELEQSSESLIQQRDLLKKNFKKYKQTAEESVRQERQEYEQRLEHLESSSNDKKECESVLMEVLHQVEVEDMRNNVRTISQLRTELALLRSATQSAEETASSHFSELQTALQNHEQASELMQKYQEQIQVITHQYENEKLTLIEQHDNDTEKIGTKYQSQLAAIQRKLDRAEVEIVLSGVMSRALENNHKETKAVDASYHEQLSDQHSQHMEQLKQQHYQEKQNIHADFTKKSTKLRSKYKEVLEGIKKENNSLQVRLCMNHLLLDVVEKCGGGHYSAAPKETAPTSAQVVGLTDEHANILEDQMRSLESQLEDSRMIIKSLEGELSDSRKKVSELAQEADQMAPMIALARKSSTKEMKASEDNETLLVKLREEEEKISKELAEIVENETALLARYKKLNADKEVTKDDIKSWTKQFQEENQREPNVEEKSAIKDKYQRYKAISIQLKEAEKLRTDLAAKEKERKERQSEVQTQIHQLQLTRTTSFKSGHIVPKAIQHMSTQTIEADLAPNLASAALQRQKSIKILERTKSQESITKVLNSETAHQNSTNTAAALAAATQNISGSDDKDKAILELENICKQDAEIIEQLEDQLYQIKQNYESAIDANAKLEKDKAFLSSQLDAFIKEKRTDVVKRYEDQIEELINKKTELNEKIASLAAEKLKNESKIKELKDRAESAEQELKERDARDQKGLAPNDEKFLLKGQIGKQREQIILKTKAATAGWDAAAKADEQLDIDVERAYKRGLTEERDEHKANMAALNESIEKKENRITELLVSIGDMEKRVIVADEEVATMRKHMEAMKLEVADTIASLSSMGGGGGDGSFGPTNAELESTREELDQAQEELVTYMEKCEKLESDLEIAREKNRIFERLAACSGLTSANGFGLPGTGSKSTKEIDPSVYDLDDVIFNVKKAIVKGTNLWKSNKRDECYDVYLSSCNDTMARLLSSDLKTPLSDSIIHGKSQGAQNKQRGAVVLRKALDRFLVDSQQPTLKKSEEDAATDLINNQAAAKEVAASYNAEVVGGLLQELNSLENSFLEQGYTKEYNPSNAIKNPESPRKGEESSILIRARNAEKMVESLKKQLAAIVAVQAETQNRPPESGPETATGPGRLQRASIAGRGGADPAEVRKLNRKIQELEIQLKNGGGAGGGGGNDDKKAQINEKQMQKKLKDLEASNKKATKALEMRATKAENALKKINDTYGSVTAEIDKLKAENAKLFNLNNEIASLRAKGEKCDELEAQVQSKTQELEILAEQFKKETMLRKKYKNELEDLKGAIRVYARCRPMAKYELEKGCRQVVQFKDETSMKLITSRGEKEFEFDAVFSPASTQDEVFEDTRRLVESCLDGFNVCLFAYGQTGSGKTFTMTGSSDLPGLTPKAIDELFRLIDDKKHCNCRVTTYFVELYNDSLVDLYWVLDNMKNPNAEPPKLDIKMDSKKMVFIKNAVIKDVSTPSELMELFHQGNLQRHTGATKMNAESSRSHSIFAIMAESYDTTTKRTTNGKLSLVDLAGSERADKTGAGAERLREAQSINKSLSALGDVIAALSEGGKHIPYRNNKLTQLMQDSLGGNAKTLMFVNFSPADYNSDETSTSLMYAQRVKKIVNNASKQAESEEVARLKSIIKKLQAGMPVTGIEELGEIANDESEPPVEDDGKVYDGY